MFIAEDKTLDIPLGAHSEGKFVYNQIFLSQWTYTLDLLRLQNMQEQRPLIRKANDYHRVLLLMKSIRSLKLNAVESKKEKNITEQKLKIKSKINNIIKQ